ncbi:MAG: 2-oxoglutarate dehydrogenase complex dihydrolipoyllysine-residue succinyltransferase [Sphingobacteriales bacterium]|nr:MAG: 2-oxoglutarate dehydrogenase complex dihydrolipoyllysine-residue succinyltransferase [Sphingobacteriales bacterium]
MMIEIKVPSVGESISEVTLVKWTKKDGDYVQRDEVLCELESEKATFELNAEQAGIFHPVAEEGATLAIGDIACKIDETASAPAGGEGKTESSLIEKPAEKGVNEAKQSTSSVEAPEKMASNIPEEKAAPAADVKATPVAGAIMKDKNVSPAEVKGTGPNGRIFKADVLSAIAKPTHQQNAPAATENGTPGRIDRPEKMSNLRKTVSRRLVEAKNTTAMLTTFNEVDMTRVMELRSANKDAFKEKHGVGLGFMSFFTRACCIALMEWPAVNAYIDGDNILYHEYCDISIAVSAPKGLVVPVIRNAESLDMAGIEKKVAELAGKARDNKLTIDEMTGGTFTITNGGVFGSLMSTPIINIPQSAILGMHKIQERPMVINGEIKIRPMMYVALSYDHRIIDGRESVSFLVRVKELLENPERLLVGADPLKALFGL